MMESWIKIYSKMLEWEWYGDPNMVATWLHLLLSANWKDRDWRGMTVKRGQIITSVAKLSEAIGQTERQTRYCLDRLEESKQIVRQTTNKFSIITICNYDSYQEKEELLCQTNVKQIVSPVSNECQTNVKQIVSPVSNECQTNVKQIVSPVSNECQTNVKQIVSPVSTPTEDKINRRTEDNIYNTHSQRAREDGEKKTFGFFNNVKLTDAEMERFRMRMAEEGRDVAFGDRVIDRLGAWLSQGRTCENHLAALLSWAKTAVLEDDYRTGTRPKTTLTSTPVSMEVTDDELRGIWERSSEAERQEYLSTHNGLTPWQYAKEHGTN